MDEYDSSDIRRLASILGGSRVEYVSLPEKKKKPTVNFILGWILFIFIFFET